MHVRRVLELVLLTWVAVAGCGGKSKAGGGQFAEFGNDEKSVLARLQGTWYVPEGTDGHREVWQVSKDKVVVHHGDGATHETKLDIVTPCHFSFADREGKRRTSSYTFAPGDVPYLSSTMTGVRKGDAILICGFGLDLHERGQCSSFTEDDERGGWRKLQVPPDPCPLVKRGDRELLELPKIESRLIMVGDAAVSEYDVDEPLERMPDLQAALARLAKPSFTIPPPPIPELP